jgi:hypothetical protein
MKYGIREICDVVFKAKGVCKVGNRIFYKDEPIMYFDTLKTSSLEAASSSVYAQGGRGNPRLIAWDGDRTLTFNMEDALISSEGLQILSGAGLIEASSHDILKIHTTTQIAGKDVVYNSTTGVITLYLPAKPYWEPSALTPTVYTNKENYAYVFPLDAFGEVWTEPYILDFAGKTIGTANGHYLDDTAVIPVYWDESGGTPKYSNVTWNSSTGKYNQNIDAYKVTLKPDITKYSTGSYDAFDDILATNQEATGAPYFGDNIGDASTDPIFVNGGAVLVDYYVEKSSGAQQIEITADKFGGTYYIEGETLFRTQQGLDMPAEFIIPNGKVQSNFTFSMAATGDPSTFTFTVDAMPDYTRFDPTKKVLAAIQIIQDAATSEASRERTYTAAPDVDVNYL